VTIVLYGATGYTGRLVTDEPVRQGLAFTLSGRSRDKLARVVINCAGPFTLAGDALVRAAIETGTPYLDSTGEQAFIRMVFERHGAAAERAGAALVPACAFDYAPGDCIARLTARGYEPLAELLIAYDVLGFGMSRGSLRSGLEMLKGDDVVYEDGDWRSAPLGVLRAHFDFPPPVGRQPVTRFPSGEPITVPRHTRVRTVRSLTTTRTTAPHPALAAALPFLRPGLELTLRTPLRPLLSLAIAALPADGPAPNERRKARFTVVAVARGEEGSTTRGIVRGEDVYGVTATALVWAADRMATDGYDRAGALGPAAAFDSAAFLDALRGHAASWQVESRSG
jgi:short subunit dehydrogenase-like uncharacterized protein